jgi:RNA polymerase primary sigma factor
VSDDLPDADLTGDLAVGLPDAFDPDATEDLAKVDLALDGTLEAGADGKLDVAGEPEAGETDRPEAAEPADDDETEALAMVEERVAASAPKDEDVQSFLAMYFRDMAELNVLRPEEEFETARNIEALEIGLWKIMLTFPAGAGWVADIVEKAMEKPLPAFKPYRALVGGGKTAPRASVRSRLDKMVEQIAAELREADIDRIFVDAVTAEVNRVVQSVRNPHHGRQGLENPPPFNPDGREFKEFARAVNAKVFAVKTAKNAFVKANLRLVVSIARRFNHGRLPLADLIQEGNIGLMKAVERYDYRRGFRFSTYASWWIRHAISRALADKGRAVRLPVHMIDAYHRIAKSERELQSKLERPATNEEIATAAGIEAEKLEKMRTFLNETPVSLDRPISDDDGRRLVDILVSTDDGPTAPEQMMVTETHSEMVKLLSSLKPIEADILRKRFGLLNDRERTLKEIGDEYRLSRERVRQLQEQALGKMRKAMGKWENL